VQKSYKEKVINLYRKVKEWKIITCWMQIYYTFGRSDSFVVRNIIRSSPELFR